MTLIIAARLDMGGSKVKDTAVGQNNPKGRSPEIASLESEFSLKEK